MLLPAPQEASLLKQDKPGTFEDEAVPTVEKPGATLPTKPGVVKVFVPVNSAEAMEPVNVVVAVAVRGTGLPTATGVPLELNTVLLSNVLMDHRSGERC